MDMPIKLRHKCRDDLVEAVRVGVELYLFSLSQPIIGNPVAPENNLENHLLEENPRRAGIPVCFIHHRPHSAGEHSLAGTQ